jgi:hypothetical protein
VTNVKANTAIVKGVKARKPLKILTVNFDLVAVHARVGQQNTSVLNAAGLNSKAESQ